MSQSTMPAIGRTLWNRRVVMRDGVELAADVLLPVGDGPWPVLVNRTPYMRGRHFPAGPWPRFIDHGYALVTVDVRGRGDSDGEFTPFTHDADDGHDVVEWVAEQPWCTGAVGMVGVSYEGLTQWWTAKGRPPHLRCIAPMAVGASSRGPRRSCDTGVPIQYWLWWYNIVTGRTWQNTGAPSWDASFDHLPLRTLHDVVGAGRKWWPKYLEDEVGYLGPDHTLTDEDWATFEVPALVALGWWDDQCTIDTWMTVKDTPAGASARLLIGAWDHQGNEGPRPMLGGLDVSASMIDPVEYIERFLAFHLKDDPSGAADVPRCRVFRTGLMEWEEMEDWPAVAAQSRAWYLRSDGGLSLTAEPDAGSNTYVYDPSVPLRDFSNLDHFAWSDPPLDSRYLLRRDDVIVFTGDELEEAVDVSGQVFFEGLVSVDAPDTDLGVSVYDVHPDGRSILLAGSGVPPPMLRLAFRDGPEPKLLTPGEPVWVRTPVTWMHHRFLPGHRIRVSITSSTFPIFARNLNQGEPWPDAVDPRVARVTIHSGGEDPSRLVLPVEPQAGPA